MCQGSKFFMLLVVLPLVFLPTTIRSLTRAWLVKWTPRLTKLVTGARVARLLPNSRATYIPSTHTGQWARTGYLYRLLSLPLLPGPDRPPHEATERLFASRRGGEDEGNALCSLRALSLSLSLSLSHRQSSLPCFLFRFHITIAFPMRVVHACHTVDCELVVGLIVWCQVLVQFSVHWR
jgi:hypothetical protein